MTTYAKIGSKKIALDEAIGTDPEAIRAHLRYTYPEVAEATIRRRTEEEHTVIEFLPKPGRKG